MFKTEIIVKIPHRLTQQEAVRRIEKGVESLRVKYAERISAFDTQWSGNQLKASVRVLGASVTSRIDVQPDEVIVAITLPFIFAMLKEKIEAKVLSRSEKLLRIK